MRICRLLISTLVVLSSFSAVSQAQVPDSLLLDDDQWSLHKRLSASTSAGKRSNDLSVKLGLQFMTYMHWRKLDFGLGVNYEDEHYFNLIPAYLHIAYSPLDSQRGVKFFMQSGLAFNIPQNATYDYGKAGIMLSAGMEQEFKLFRIIPSSFQLLYRYQQSSTVREWSTNGQADQTLTNSVEIKHTMHRIMLVFGVNF